jgi:hypothetical protein
MVAPVTGPFTEEIGGSASDNLVNYYSYKSGYKQAPPHNLVTAYRRRIGTVGSRSTTNPSMGARYIGANPCTIDLISSSTWNQVTSQCYERLKSKVSDRSALGVTLLELDQSVEMIRRRALDLYRFGRQLVRGNLVGAARELKLAVVPKGANVKKSFANNYLEFHFGWAPLVSDIHDAYNVLQSPIKDQFVRASAKGADVSIVYTPLTITQSGASYPSPYYAMDHSYRNVSSIGVRMGATVGVTNPNLWLANQLGLINPAVLVYEKIPFSFIADWFFNVQQFLELGTDWVGLSISNGWTTRHAKSTVVYKHLWLYQNSSGDKLDWATQNWWLNGTSSDVSRVSGLTLPTFGARPFKIWGWRRTAAAVSLLTQQVTGRR